METRLGQRGMAIIFGVAAGLGLVVLSRSAWTMSRESVWR